MNAFNLLYAHRSHEASTLSVTPEQTDH